MNEKNILKIVIPLIILGLVGISPLLIYGVILNFFPTENTIYRISSEGNWADFASLWSAAFGALGAIATSATLAFLVWQFIFKQKELIDKNIEVINFQKYQLHKQLFNEMLDGLERRYNREITFLSRDVLYINLFPKNNFSNVEYKIDLSEHEAPYSLLDLKHRHASLNRLIESKTKLDNCSPLSLISEIADLQYHLGQMQLARSSHSGDFLWDKKVVINIQNPAYFLSLMDSTLGALLDFSGNSQSFDRLDIHSGRYLMEKLALLSKEIDGISPHQKEIFGYVR